MKETLLEITQDILNDMDSDEVNSIDDTFEATQVAQIVKRTFFEMIGNRNWPHLNQLFKLEGVPSSDTPTHMKLPSDVKELIYLGYNKQREGETRNRYETIRYQDPDSFLRRLNQNNNDNDEVEVIIDFSGVELNIRTDRHPEVWTSFDDAFIVFDSFDKDVNETLLSSKVQARGYLNPTWVHLDSHIPDLPIEAFPALIEEAKSVCFFVLKQQANEKAEQKSTRQQRWLARKAWKANGGIKYPNFGRKGRKGRLNPLFDKED